MLLLFRHYKFSSSLRVKIDITNGAIWMLRPSSFLIDYFYSFFENFVHAWISGILIISTLHSHTWCSPTLGPSSTLCPLLIS